MGNPLFQFHHKIRPIYDQTGISKVLLDYDNVSRMPSSQYGLKI